MNLRIFSLFSLLTIAMAAMGQTADSATLNRQILFKRGDMGSTFWRIPALATTDSGVVVAVADKRNDRWRDLPNDIDLVARLSYDNGLTWSEPQYVVRHDAVGGYGDASLGVHHPTGDLLIVCAHGNGVWEATEDEPQHLVAIRSTDDGKTWGEPVDITAQFYGPASAGAPLNALAGFATSGTMLCDNDGRLSFVLVAHTNDEMWGPLACYMCYSDDGGRTWSLSPEVDDYGDESKVTQLADGSYFMSIRNRRLGGRRVSRSTDRGEHWTAPRATSQLIDPACNGDLITILPDQLVRYGLDKIFGEKAMANGLMVHSLVDDPHDRRNVSVFASDDMGVTWRKIYTVTPDGSGYSAVSLLPDGTLGIFSEEDNPDGGYDLWFTKVDLAKVEW